MELIYSAAQFGVRKRSKYSNLGWLHLTVHPAPSFLVCKVGTTGAVVEIVQQQGRDYEIRIILDWAVRSDN